MSLVLPLPKPPRSPHRYPISRSSTPTSSSRQHSRPSTPPPHSELGSLQPISAPPTPVIPTHLGPFEASCMERCRSSEAAFGTSIEGTDNERDGRGREPKATPLLYADLPDADEIQVLGPDPKEKSEWVPVESTDGDEKMDVDEVDEVGIELGGIDVKAEKPVVWGMPRWGWEDERKAVRKGVRLVGVEELPGLIDQHAMIDTPSHVLFPWLHGISDDGAKGRDMAAFFGYAPPFEPPPYRGLCLLLSPPHPLDMTPERPAPEETDSERTDQPSAFAAPLDRDPRERSETMSTSSESYHSSGTTEGTSPSVADFNTPNSPKLPSAKTDEPETDVQMHPCESKRVSPEAMEEGLDVAHHPLPCDPPLVGTDSDSDSDDESEEEARPSCILLNALHVQDIFELPKNGIACFRPAKLPQQINLRNLNIQQIKYATISDVVLYTKHGVGNGVLDVAEQIARAQEELWQQRMTEFYCHMMRAGGEGLNEPVRYGVWVLVEPFHKVEKFCPHLVNIGTSVHSTPNSGLTDLFEREAKESRAMTRGSEVVEGFWVGNDCDVPGGADDGAGSHVSFDLCVKASECADMPTTAAISSTYRKLLDLDRRRHASNESSHAWVASPATVALRNLLSPVQSPVQSMPDVGSKRVASPSRQETARRRRSRLDEEYVSLDCAGSCRTITGQMRNLNTMSDRVVELVYFLRKVIEGRDKSGTRRRVLVHCQDGYTESSIFVLSYIMSSLSVSLPEAFLHLQLNAKRSFFLYPSDKPLLRKIDARLAADRRAKAIKLVSSTPNSSPTGALSSRWKGWGLGLGKNGESPDPKKQTVESARDLLVEEEKGGSAAANEARVWFDDRRFDGFPSRILPFLYLGNLDHASNAAMLHAVGISHVVSVGESLLNCPDNFDPSYGQVGSNQLAAEARAGRIQVLDLTDVRDDGNDPLRPLIARACEWIEQARSEGGCVLVHCRVGVSRSASIVMAYMMQHLRMGLMDAYLMTRARRLNVLIQPNLRFFHELFGWEVELARREADDRDSRKLEAERAGVSGAGMIGDQDRRILYSWPSFCRDLHCLNRRFLCN